MIAWNGLSQGWHRGVPGRIHRFVLDIVSMISVIIRAVAAMNLVSMLLNMDRSLALATDFSDNTLNSCGRHV